MKLYVICYNLRAEAGRQIMHESSIPQGIWESTYSYPSSGRQKTFDGHHYVRLHQKDNHLVFESIKGVNKSYLIIRLSVDDDIATGSWQEQTEPEGYYKGAIYYGAIQLVVDKDRSHMTGKWVGFGKEMEVNVGPWELAYVGTELPDELREKAALTAS
jgi:hypothetical protein